MPNLWRLLVTVLLCAPLASNLVPTYSLANQKPVVSIWHGQAAWMTHELLSVMLEVRQADMLLLSSHACVSPACQ